MKFEKTSGLIAAPFTPMDEDGSVNVAIVPAYADHLKQQGVAGVFVNGTTGEGLSLSNDERMALARAWRASTGGQALKLIVHVTHLCPTEAGRLARDAAEIGADAIAVMAPPFFTPALDEMLAFASAVAEQAPALPLYYYHMPSMAGTAFSMYALIQRAARRIPNFAGIKFTHYDLMDYQRALEYADGAYDVLFGRDEYLLGGLAVGARAAVGSTYNYAAPIYTRLIDAFRHGDLETARRCQAASHGLVRLLEASRSGIAAGKAIMEQLSGLEMGPCRLPLPRLPDAELAWLRSELETWRGEQAFCAAQEQALPSMAVAS